VISRAAEVGLWTPTNETVTAIGAALCAHWAAAQAVAKNQFWLKPSSWLDPPQNRLAHYHLTIGGKLMRYASGSASVPNPNRVPRS
jgi:hypothetical protein